MYQQPILLEPSVKPSACVIWLHGLGATGDDFVPIVPALELPPNHSIRFLFPHAPQKPVTINGGMVMPAWYDVLDASIERRVDLEGVRQSSTYVETLIDDQLEQGIGADRILLAGFSQGGAIALHAGLCGSHKLAGILAMSTYLTCEQEIKSDRQDLPVFMAHGSEDPVVPLSLGSDSHRRLSALGFKPSWQTWPMGHEVCLEEIEAIGSWMQALLIK